MNIFEFLNLVKKEPDKWKNYCEILILKNGGIELAIPSHQEKLIDIYCEREQITREQFKNEFPITLSPDSFICEKYSIIPVWYNYMIISNDINRFQRRTIKLLRTNNLISETLNFMLTTGDYSWYLKNRQYVKRFLKEK